MMKNRYEETVIEVENKKSKKAEETIEIKEEIDTKEVVKIDMKKEKVKKEDLIAKLEEERDDFKDKWLRTLAEFENFRKNTQKDKQDWIKYSNEKIILDLCDVLDNFERALGTEINSKNFSSYVKGVELIFQQLNTVLKKHDVVKLECLGKEFDPNFHEALSTIPSKEPEDTIVAVIQNGYMIGERLIRPSRVAVSNGEIE